MKQRLIIVCLATLIVAVIGACQASGTNPETSANTNSNTNAPATTAMKTESPDVAGQLKDLLAQHDKGLNEKNLDAVMATYSTDANTVMLGTGSEEKWVGQQEIRGAYSEIFKDYDPNTLHGTCDWKTGGADETGTMAWMAAICSLSDSMQGKTRNYKLNVSAAAKKVDGQWHFVMLHMSNAFAPPETKAGDGNAK